MNSEPSNQKESPYLKYSGLAFQLIAVIIIAYYLGKFLDNTFNPGNPKYFTVILFLVLLSGYLYKVIKDLTGQSK